jgi:hypothetical protein
MGKVEGKRQSTPKKVIILGVIFFQQTRISGHLRIVVFFLNPYDESANYEFAIAAIQK